MVEAAPSPALLRGLAQRRGVDPVSSRSSWRRRTVTFLPLGTNEASPGLAVGSASRRSTKVPIVACTRGRLASDVTVRPACVRPSSAHRCARLTTSPTLLVNSDHRREVVVERQSHPGPAVGGPSARSSRARAPTASTEPCSPRSVEMMSWTYGRVPTSAGRRWPDPPARNAGALLHRNACHAPCHRGIQALQWDLRDGAAQASGFVREVLEDPYGSRSVVGGDRVVDLSQTDRLLGQNEPRHAQHQLRGAASSRIPSISASPSRAWPRSRESSPTATSARSSAVSEAWVWHPG